MVKRFGIGFGAAFLFGGLLGFVPGVIKDGMYLGIFMVNTPHNILHLASGSIFLIASIFGPGPTRLSFQIFGTFYAALTVIGFVVGDGIT